MTLPIQKTILVTGSGGQLGMELQKIAPHFTGFRFLFTQRDTLPIENFNLVKSYFEDQQIDTCINCAAYTAVDKAESEKDLAFVINGDAVGYLAKLCKAHQAQFIHISTDYVFDGTSDIAYSEDDSIAPVNAYGASKLKGEELAFNNNPSSIILRTSWLYSSFGNNFVKTMLRLMKERTNINVVSDQFGCPTYAHDLANVIMKIVCTDINTQGLFNYSNSGVTTWYEFAMAIKAFTNSKCEIRPIETIEYPTPAKRPKFSVLDTSKITAHLHLQIPNWKDSLNNCLELLHAV